MLRCDRCDGFTGAELVPVACGGETELWCDTCADEYGYMCDKCERVYSTDNAFPLNSDGVCWNCISIRNDIIHDRYRDEL